MMKRLEDMTQEEKLTAINIFQLYIESAIESEQEEPADFKIETQQRIELILVNLKEIFGFQHNS
jgi:hypothetical protein